MDLARLISRYKNLVFNLALIILALMVAGNISRKQAKGLELLKEKKEAELKKNKVLGNIQQLETGLVAYKKLLTKQDADLVINTVSSLARESGVKIVSLKPAPEQRNPEYIKFPLDLAVTSANYHALGKFISKLESNKDIYKVEALEIKPVGENQELSANLVVTSIAFVNP